ncbi:hypothetical protein ACFFQW_20505 [Umezawaea endophytica]|uniref:Uncharacterized protein n=1 Tax=Umezawaea endophytica TaxID=1654476 RepID=A0A9X2VV95_9PSEU|nr:hypothetical protein [Umezawaea endophytica]MCS7482303.1 hypothetical protein [Umezawaea endophytica]
MVNLVLGFIVGVAVGAGGFFAITKAKAGQRQGFPPPNQGFPPQQGFPPPNQGFPPPQQGPYPPQQQQQQGPPQQW